ncbi:putative Ig domain-containing protein [Hyalangium rubrum]|uniref:Ig domain-containing protein n=1 Tax=Hyalangium rubrum TaxID=3103134 RepID=A0ABU5GYH8_9BACT|nr:putative Ig domain-containing protein [Hyalangium sp. s54d21]MDY7226215.1 putative Ig domain-containing protein [Hyalangium sp. s54d21]
MRPPRILALLLLALLFAPLEARPQGAPLLTPEQQLPGAQLPVELNRLSAAFDGTNFLLVWSDVRGSDPDIYGARISVAGELLAPGAFPISTAPGEQSFPDVAFNGTNFLVTWNDSRTGDASNIYGVLVSTAGAIRDPGQFKLSTGPSGTEKYVPSVDCVGSECLVIWSERRATTSWDILGVTVNASGTVTSAGDQVISGVNRGQYVPEVVRAGPGYVAAWSDQRDASAYGIYGVEVSATAQPATATGTDIEAQASSTYERPALVWDGTSTWAAWTNTLLNPSAPAIHLRGTPSSTQAVTFGEVTRNPALAFDGHWLWVAYEFELPNAEHGVNARRFDRNGLAVETAPFPLSGTDPGASVPHLASDGQGHVLVVYASHDLAAPHATTDRLIYRVATSLAPGAVCGGDAECSTGTCADGRCCDRRCDGVCETCRLAEGASADGVCGLATARVCRPAASTCDVAERCDGNQKGCPADVLAADETSCGTEAVCRAGGCQFLPPRFLALSRAQAVCGQAARYEGDTPPTVAGAGPYTFSVEGGPEGLTVEPSTGALRWVPERAAKGSHSAALRVTGPGGSAVETLSITVECPEPHDLRVACGCTGGGEGPWLLALSGLLAGAWRRRR